MLAGSSDVGNDRELTLHRVEDLPKSLIVETVVLKVRVNLCSRQSVTSEAADIGLNRQSRVNRSKADEVAPIKGAREPIGCLNAIWLICYTEANGPVNAGCFHCL
jgi:hypothetical protein